MRQFITLSRTWPQSLIEHHMSEKSAKKRTNIAPKFTISRARQTTLLARGFKPRAVLTGGVYACAESLAYC